MSNKKQDIALVLSGGGARGMAHIGVIETMLENGYNISAIAGTSIGSLIGGIYASGNLDSFKAWVKTQSRMDIFRLMDVVISKSGLIRGEKVFKELGKFISDKNIEDLPIPYAAVAVDVRNHKEIIFTSGKLKDAIRASVSVPTVFKPKMHNGIELVDGGVLNPLPLNRVNRIAGDQLWAVDLNASIPYQQPIQNKEQENVNQNYLKALDFINEKWTRFFKNGKPKKSSGFFDIITLSVYAMQIKLTQIAIEKHQPDLVVEISKKSCDLFEFHRSEELINYGRKQLEIALSAKLNTNQ